MKGPKWRWRGYDQPVDDGRCLGPWQWAQCRVGDTWQTRHCLERCQTIWSFRPRCHRSDDEARTRTARNAQAFVRLFGGVVAVEDELLGALGFVTIKGDSGEGGER